MNWHDHAAHHAANIAAIVIPTLSFSLNGPAVLTYTTSVLGIVWYGLLIGEKIYHWTKRRKR